MHAADFLKPDGGMRAVEWSDMERLLSLGGGRAGPFAVSNPEQHALGVGGNGLRTSERLTETHLILYVAWRKLWMERLSPERSVGMMSLMDLHRAVASEASRLSIDKMQLCSVVPDFRQTAEIARALTWRGALVFHKCGGGGGGGGARLCVAMSEKTGQDMMDSINASTLDRMEEVQDQIFEAKRAESAASDGGQGARKKRRTNRPVRPVRKKVFHIPRCVLELHLECERRDLVAENKRFKESTMMEKKKPPSDDGSSSSSSSSTSLHLPGRQDST